MTRHVIATAAGVVCLVGYGCSQPKPSSELVRARSVYAEAAGGETAQQNPDELREAQVALREAEEAYEDDPGSERARDLAYIADRKTRLAMAHARAETLAQSAEQGEDQYTRQLEQRASAQRNELEGVQQELAVVRTELDAQGDTLNARTEELRERESELAARETELMAEREAREEAEQRAQEAMTRLEEIAAIQQEQDRIVITLNGSVLFRTGSSDLMASATERLEQVASALKSQDPNARIVVEGHTDSRGDDAQNQQLSQARARSVMDFLTQQGIETGRISAVGRGEEQPVADNDTAEGRANNRRVEIILDRSSTARADGATRPSAG